MRNPLFPCFELSLVVNVFHFFDVDDSFFLNNLRLNSILHQLIFNRRILSLLDSCAKSFVFCVEEGFDVFVFVIPHSIKKLIWIIFHLSLNVLRYPNISLNRIYSFVNVRICFFVIFVAAAYLDISIRNLSRFRFINKFILSFCWEIGFLRLWLHHWVVYSVYNRIFL